MSEDSVTQALREMIIDENKIVTYKTLSRFCSIHVNRAKQSLEEFLNTEEGLNASYLLSGFVKEDSCDHQSSGYYVAVVPGSKLEEVKGKFKQLDSCHVYSVQKALLKDSGVLYTANSEKTPSSDQVPKPVIRNSKLITNRKLPSAVKTSTSSEPQKKEEVKPKAEPAKVTSPQNVEKHMKTQSKPAVNGKGGKANGIMAAFMKGQSNNNNNKKSSPPVKKEDTVNKSSQADSKSNGIKVSEKSSVDEKSSPKAKDLKKAEKQMWSSESSSDEEVVAPPRKRTKTMNRIKQLPESDSEDESEKNGNTVSSQDSEDPLPNSVKKDHRISDSDDEDVIPPTPDANKTARQYVSVKNTYLDDDGFLVTRKEHKLEEVELPKPPPAPVNKNKSPPNNTTSRGKPKKGKSAPDDKRKQLSMTSFFTKK